MTILEGLLMNVRQRRLKQARYQHKAVILISGRFYTITEAGALAIKEQNLKNFQGAMEIYHRILAKFPDSAPAHNNRGVTLLAMKRYDEALASFNQAITLQPGHAEAHNSRGAVLQYLGRYDDALASYDKAIALNPGYANAHHNRGSTLRRINRQGDALASFEKAIVLKPDHAEAHNDRGVTLQEMKRYDDALASFDKAIALKTDHAGAYNNRGLHMVIKGHMPEAEKMFLKAIELEPAFPSAWFNLANIREYQNTDHADVQNIRGLLNRPEVSPDDQEYLYFSLGKICDDCGRYDEAFEYYRLANHIRNLGAAYDSKAVVKTTNDIMDVFSKDFLVRPFAFASESHSPLFIVGMPGSGTTLLANILSNHRSIATVGELPTMPDLASGLVRLTEAGIPYPQAAKYITASMATHLIDDYTGRLRRDVGSDVPHVIDKNPLNFRHLGFISKLFPEARFIHCSRHPLDTCLSNYFRRFPLSLNYSFDLQNIGHFYGEYWRLMMHWREVLPLKMIEITYDDMVVNTEQMVRRTLDCLGLAWDERCLAPHTNRCAVETASQWQVRQPIYSHSLNRWRNYEPHLAPLKERLRAVGGIPLD